MTAPVVLIERPAESVMLIRINRPEARNALNMEVRRLIAKHLTEHSASKLREWWATASAPDRERYFKTLMTDEVPLFVFDASPLVLVYTRRGTAVRERYFVMSGTHTLEWDDNPPITDGRRLFTGGPLREAAALPEPFSSLRID